MIVVNMKSPLLSHYAVALYSYYVLSTSASGVHVHYWEQLYRLLASHLLQLYTLQPVISAVLYSI